MSIEIPMSAAARQRSEEYKAWKRAEQASATPWFERGEGVLPDPPQAEPPEIGSTLTFRPSAFEGSGDIDGVLHQKVTGTVVYVNEAHRWYRVAYQTNMPGCIGYEGFKY